MATQIPGKFVWFELSTPQTKDAIAFYSETLGFKVHEMDMGDFVYTMFAANAEAKPHSGLPPRQPGDTSPAHWLSYVSVPSVDESLSAVKANGGSVLVPAMDIPVGRLAVVADPQGAAFALWTGNDDDPADGLSETGGWHWNELWAKDADAVLPFYTAVLGYEVESMDMPNGKYHVLKTGETPRGGVMTSPDANIPAMWLPYIHVDDADATVARAKSNGGDPKGELMTVPGVGRFGIFLDSVGAAIGVITPDRPAA